MRATCSAGARARRASVRARSSDGRRPCASQPARLAQRVARAASSRPHGRLGGVRRGRAAHRRDVVDQRAVGVVSDRADHRHAQQRDGAAERLVAEREQVGEVPPPRHDDGDVDRGTRGKVAQRRAIAGAAWRSCTGAKAQTIVPRQPRRSSPASRSARRLAALASDDADRARQRGRGSAFCGSNSPSASSCAAQLARAARAGRPRPRAAGR